MPEKEIQRTSAEFGSRSSEMVPNGDSQKLPSSGEQIRSTLGEIALRKSPRLMKSVELASAEAARTNVNRKNTVIRSAGEKIESLRKSPRLLKSTEPVFLTPEMTNDVRSRKSLRSKSADAEVEKQPLKKQKVLASNEKQNEVDGPCVFVGDPICMDEARKRWPWRYDGSVFQIFPP
ncbi:hypothetical protein ACLOJK_030266 [Asimina triloba]